MEGKKTPIKTDLFTELDPLGTGRVKPYVDKKDFFQELKNPPKKVLKEMIPDAAPSEPSPTYFSGQFVDRQSSPIARSESTALDTSLKEGNRYSKGDPFEEGDPFEKTDPFQEDNFSSSVGFPPFGAKSSLDEIFNDKVSWKFDKPTKESEDNKPSKVSSTALSLLTSSTLRVSLPPEKPDPLTLSTIASRLKSPPNSPEDSKNLRRKYYQALKQSTVEGSEDSPVHEEPFVSTKVPSFGSRTDIDRKSPFKERLYCVQSPTSFRCERFLTKISSSAEILDATTPDPPPRAKTALFSIKPPPLPPKKISQSSSRPPAPPPSTEESNSHYDYLKQKESPSNEPQYKEELKCVKLKKQPFTGKDSPPCTELKKQSSETAFPVLPPPPHRKSSMETTKQSTLKKSEIKYKTAATDGSILNLKLTQLDNTGLENLAITLGIPSENIYSMTLQELTKMLAEKYLMSNKDPKPEDKVSESFEVDFDANFGQTETNLQNPSTSYDKYAVFKELIESENKTSESAEKATTKEPEEEIFKETTTQEDKYAALRQLSVNAINSENTGENIDEENNTLQEKVITVNSQLQEEAPGSSNITLGVSSSDDTKSKWDLEATETSEYVEKQSLIQKQHWQNPTSEEKKDTQLNESQLFPLVDKFSDDKKSTQRDNWATFEKSDFEETIKKTENENENSPFSSDGKEDVREIPFQWYKNWKKNRKDVPWRDDDESWDDYSPKESFCSDESSHEERSPEVGREDRYEKPPWSLRPPKTDRFWDDKSSQWNRRDKWQEETEDEFEDSWRKQRQRAGSYDSDRKNDFWYNNYEGYGKRYEWYNSRSEPWDDNDRHHYYGSRSKRSESDNEYRKRCDSDTSDKECVWGFQKNYPDSHGRSGKSKYHSSSHSCRDCPEHFHESRKHRKGLPQKRPNSASDSKRNYEMFSPEEYFRGDKTYPGKREFDKDQYSRFQYGYSRTRPDIEYPHYCSSYDRKTTHHNKGGSRTSRASGQSDLFLSPNKHPKDNKPHDFSYFEPFCDKNYKYGKPENRHFQFESENEAFEKGVKPKPEQSLQDFRKSPDRRPNQWAATNGKAEGNALLSSKNNNETFANFKEDFKISPKKAKDTAKLESHSEAVIPKNKNHLAMMSRQESSTTLRKSDSINIFSRDKDPFEDDDFFSSVS